MVRIMFLVRNMVFFGSDFWFGMVRFLVRVCVRFAFVVRVLVLVCLRFAFLVRVLGRVLFRLAIFGSCTFEFLRKMRKHFNEHSTDNTHIHLHAQTCLSDCMLVLYGGL